MPYLDLLIKRCSIQGILELQGNEPGSSSNDPPAVPGLPVTEGEFPIIHETPAPSDQVPIPETGSDSDSDATVDYRERTPV